MYRLVQYARRAASRGNHATVPAAQDYETGSREDGAAADAVLDKRRLQALGVLLPIRLHALSFLPGRHPLGRAGEGMRFLRSRPYEPGHDNPRDIDKFSPSDEYWINEWEAEAQAVIRVYGDVSASMSFPPKAAVRNLALLQLTYSLWRAADRVRVDLYSADAAEQFAEPNLKGQLESLVQSLAAKPVRPGQDAIDMLEHVATSLKPVRDDLAFLVSDFCPVDVRGAEESRQRWRSLLQRLYADIVPVLISFELSRAQRGTIKLWDPERQAKRLTLLTPARVDRINEQERQRITGLENLFRSIGLDYLTLRHERDVYPAIAQLARMRRRRRM